VARLLLGLIEDGSADAPAQERLGRLQGFVGGDGRTALLNDGDNLNDIALANLRGCSYRPRSCRSPGEGA